MNRQEAIKRFQQMKKTLSIPNSDATRTIEAIDIAIKAMQGDMYCPSCGVRLVSENEYVEPKPYKGE